MPTKQQLSHTALLMLIQIGIQAATYLYYAVLARWLEPTEFTAYVGLTAFFSIYSVIGISLQQSAARATSLGQSVTIPNYLIWLGAAGVGLSMPILMVYAHLPWYWTLALGLMIPVYIRLSVWRGIQLVLAPKQLGLNLMLEHGSKLLLTPVLALIFGLVDAAALVIPISIGLAAWHVRKQKLIHSPKSDFDGFLLHGFFQLFLANLDVLLAQTLLEPAQASVYIQAALLARVMGFLALNLTQASTQTLTTQPLAVWRVMLWITGVAMIYLCGIALLGNQVGLLMFGTKLEVNLWMLLVVASGLLSLCSLLLQTALLRGHKPVLVWWLFGLGLQISVMLISHQSAYQLASGLVWAALLWLVAILWQHKNLAQQGEVHVLPKIQKMA